MTVVLGIENVLNSSLFEKVSLLKFWHILDGIYMCVLVSPTVPFTHVPQLKVIPPVGSFSSLLTWTGM
jgi:hypothetical protein